MISDSEIVARYNAEEARLGGYEDKHGVINHPRVMAATAEALGVDQKRVAQAMSAHWSTRGAG